MAKLYFNYSAMNAGKTTTLLQSDFNYQERGMKTLCFLPEIAALSFNDKIESRIGLSKAPIILTPEMDIKDYVVQYTKLNTISCIFIDEAQFLSQSQVWQLCAIVDQCHIPVLTYGLRTDFQGELFEGSQYLLALADQLIEIKTICFCGKKAIMNARVDSKGEIIKIGAKILCGSNNQYISLCRHHFSVFQSGLLSPAAISYTPVDNFSMAKV